MNLMSEKRGGQVLAGHFHCHYIFPWPPSHQYCKILNWGNSRRGLRGMFLGHILAGGSWDLHMLDIIFVQ